MSRKHVVLTERYAADKQTVLDHKTGLIWERTPKEDMTFKACLGFKGLRLPTIEELLTLVDWQKRYGVVVDSVIFPKVLPSVFWTSTFLEGSALYQGEPNRVFGMSMLTGYPQVYCIMSETKDPDDDKPRPFKHDALFICDPKTSTP